MIHTQESVPAWAAGVGWFLPAAAYGVVGGLLWRAWRLERCSGVRLECGGETRLGGRDARLGGRDARLGGRSDRSEGRDVRLGGRDARLEGRDARSEGRSARSKNLRFSELTGFALCIHKLEKVSASCHFSNLWMRTAHCLRVHYIIYIGIWKGKFI